MNKKNNFLILGIFLVLTLTNVLALGVTPGKNTLQYPDDLNGNFSFKILNSEKKDFSVSISVQGELSNYITLNKNYLDFSFNESFKEVIYSLNIPNDLSYGEHKGQIIISEISEGDSAFGSKVGVIMGIVVFVPYPSKYIESNLDVYSVKNKTVFLIPVINRGENKLNNVNAIINIYSLGQKIESISSDSIELNSMQRSDIVIEKDENLFGNYQANVILNYDNEMVEFDKNFTIGEPSVDVFDVFIENFELGSIVQMDVLVQNKWTEPLKNIYASLILNNESGEVVNIKSAPQDVEGKSKTRIPIYWDTSGIERGNYFGNLIINYSSYSNSKKINVEISDYGIGIELESGDFILEEKINLSSKILISLVIFGIVFIILFTKFIKKK